MFCVFISRNTYLYLISHELTSFPSHMRGEMLFRSNFIIFPGNHLKGLACLFLRIKINPFSEFTDFFLLRRRVILCNGYLNGFLVCKFLLQTASD